MRKLMALGMSIVVLATACGGGDDSDGDSLEPAPVDSAQPADSAAPAADQAAEGAGVTASIADGWSATLVGSGTKPSLALDTNGQPAVVFLLEDIPDGFVAYASSTDDWTVDLLVEGYFYGPIGLDFDLENRPNIAYHDHQAAAFDQELGDLTYAVRDAGGWLVEAAESDGHDGWDSTIRVGADGVVRAAGVDPAQFNREAGIEYYELVDGTWVVEAIGSGPIDYEWNVDLQVASDSTVGMTYFATSTSDLIFASRSPGEAWVLDTVAADGDVGRFSSFAFDADGFAHISYWNAETGEILYATNRTGTWENSSVAVLSSVELGFEGARRISSLALDPDGGAVIAYSDTSGVWLARQDGDVAWHSQRVITAGALPLGQLVSLAVDADNAAHIAYFEVTGNNPLSGEVVYVAGGG